MNHLHCQIYSCDDDYLRDIRAGGTAAENAIGCLYLRYRKQTYTYLSKMLSRHHHSKSMVEDLVHDAYIIMIEKIRYDQVRINTLGGFWIGIGRYLVANRLKQDARTILVQDPGDVYTALDEVASTWVVLDLEEKDWMERAFRQLESRCREVLRHWMDGFTMQEIAVKMNLGSDAMARKLKYHCFKKLKEIVRNGYIPER